MKELEALANRIRKILLNLHTQPNVMALISAELCPLRIFWLCYMVRF